MAGVRVRNTTVNGGMTGVDEGINKIFAHKEGTGYSTMKRRTSGVNPNTVAQQAVRAMFAQTSAGWSALTEAQRNAWNAAAPDWGTTGIFGDKQQSGKNLYTGCNVTLQSAGKAMISTPSAKNLIAVASASNFVNAAGVLTLSTIFSTPSAANQVQLLVSKQKSAGTSKNDKYVVLKNVAAGAAVNQVVTADYTAKYGALISGKKIFFKIKLVSAGGNSVVINGGSIVNP